MGTTNAVELRPAKIERNQAERGLAFDIAEELDWSSAPIVEDRRRDYEERRYQTLGSIGEHLHLLVFAPRGGAVHVRTPCARQAGPRAG